jgi:hypothetical protein
MITVTKRILQSENISKQQYIAIIVVLSDHTNNATCCEVLAQQYSVCEFWEIRLTVYDNGNKKNTTIRKH